MKLHIQQQHGIEYNEHSPSQDMFLGLYILTIKNHQGIYGNWENLPKYYYSYRSRVSGLGPHHPHEDDLWGS
jgi:hypothetical protein